LSRQKRLFYLKRRLFGVAQTRKVFYRLDLCHCEFIVAAILLPDDADWLPLFVQVFNSSVKNDVEKRHVT
jgi:hypothetical protein